MRALYDPPFLFELSTTCMSVYKKYDNTDDGYIKYRVLSIPDAKRIYPDVCELLCTEPEKQNHRELESARIIQGLCLDTLQLD